MANNTTLRDGTGALFTAESIDVGAGVQRTSTAANLRIGNAEVAIANPVPTQVTLSGSAVSSTNPLPVTEGNGSAIAAASMPAGGVGQTGWLSAIWARLASTVTTALGTAQRVVLVDPVSGNGSLVQAFHNADNQSLGGTAYGLMTGGVDQLLNVSGNLDRKRAVWGDGMAGTGVAAEVPMLWNGATYDRASGSTALGAKVQLAQSGAYGTGTVTIANAATISGTISMPTGGRLAGLIIPSAFTGTAVSFKVSVDGTNFSPFKQGGAAVSIAVAAGDAVDLLGSYPGLSAWPYVAVVSNASEAATRTLNCVTV